MRHSRTLHALLGGCALLLALNLAVTLTNGPAPAAGLIQTAHAQGATNAAQQREQMIAQLKSLSSKVDALNSKLSGALTVRVEGPVETKD
ncbi:MAG: hypothetical protein AAF586_06445 [Planctomycetota bacterium]